MAANTLRDERAELEAFRDLLQQWHDSLVDDLPAVDRGTLAEAEQFYDRWRQTASKWSTSISRQLPPALEPEEVAEIRGELIEILGAIAEYDPERPLDSVDVSMVHLEAIRHVVRDAIDGHVAPEDDAREMLRRLETTLPRTTRKALAALLGTSDRSIQRILSATEPVPPSRRLLMVTRLVELLRRAWTPEGVMAWFFRGRHDLGGRAPIEVMDDPAIEHALLSAARQGRAQHGS